MRCTAGLVSFFAAMLFVSATATATQIQVNGVTTFFSNYEDDTNVATGNIPTAQYSTPTGGYLPDAPQFGSWNSFQGTDSEASPPTTFVQNVQVTDFATPPGAYSGDQYLRTFRTPSGGAFAQNPGTRIGYDGSNVTANLGDTYHFETMIRSQLQVTTVTTLGVLGVNDLSTFSGVDLIGIAFRSDGAIMSKSVNSPSTFVDTGLDWVQNTWDVLKIDYVDGADNFTLTYGNQTPVLLSLILDTAGGSVLGNKRVGLVTFGNGAGGAASGDGAINGGAGSRLYYDSVGLVPIPEPGSFLTMGFGILGLCMWRRYRG